jgi:CMP-N-acetylneuraminic acid synthetase
MIPARLGSQRLHQKNLLTIDNKSIVKICAEKCVSSLAFEQVYINSESDKILNESPHGCLKYKRKNILANNRTTSEDFVKDFLTNIECDYLFQIHSIAPLLKIEEIINFVDSFIDSQKQVGLCYEKIILETTNHLNEPINFSFQEKQNSQDLPILKKINWCMTGWKTEGLLNEECLSFGSDRYFHEVTKLSGFVIKTMEDYFICKKLLEKKC